MPPTKKDEAMLAFKAMGIPCVVGASGVVAAAAGHTLCNHTWKHDTKLGTRNEDAIRADIKRTQEAA